MFVLPAASPPGAFHADFLILEAETLTAKNIEVDLADHIGGRGERLTETAAKPGSKEKMELNIIWASVFGVSDYFIPKPAFSATETS